MRTLATVVAGWVLGVYGALLAFGPDAGLAPMMTIPPTIVVLGIVQFLTRTASWVLYVGGLGAAVVIADIAARVLGLL
ncbi:hypothetical protein [Mongoliimonas terrestris]|uniref:hypothetical protein n=1 Tax=Mongoliimonas terrestris TaxID=1709001 RepID=UPI000949AA77|nr:hypothetical protein [Mongoliimonas terrestris]